jgi:hypothetical protein
MAADMAAVSPQRPHEYAAIRNAGVTILRQGFRQEYAANNGYDTIVLDAARAGLAFMPIIIGPWPPSGIPGFAAMIAARYGRGGSLWSENTSVPAHPTTKYQVWNEPNFPSSWGGRPSASEYVRMLNATALAIRGIDPQAEILSAGIADSKQGIPLEKYVHAIRGAHFDSLAVHSYPARNETVVDTIHKGMHAMGGDRGVWLTEFGWATSGPKSSHTVTESVQAARISQTIKRLYTVPRLRGFVYYGWQDLPPYPGRSDYWGFHTGLARMNGTPKPSRRAFTKAIRRGQP